MTHPRPSVVALLTGRGNNTFVNKNIAPVLGRPLLWYIANACKNVPGIDHFFCSSDCPLILEEARKIGYTSIVRPSSLASPTSAHVDCIVHALEEMQQNKIVPDILIVLLANSATVKSEWIRDCLGFLFNDVSISAAAPVHVNMDVHPVRARRLTIDGCVEPYLDLRSERVSTNRQDLPTCAFFDHSFWVIRTPSGRIQQEGHAPWTFMGWKVKPLFTSGCFDVHDRNDLEKTEQWLIENGFAPQEGSHQS